MVFKRTTRIAMRADNSLHQEEWVVEMEGDSAKVHPASTLTKYLIFDEGPIYSELKALLKETTESSGTFNQAKFRRLLEREAALYPSKDLFSQDKPDQTWHLNVKRYPRHYLYHKLSLNFIHPFLPPRTITMEAVLRVFQYVESEVERSKQCKEPAQPLLIPPSA